MHTLKSIVLSACIVSAAVQSYAGQGAYQAGALTELERITAGTDLNGLYDNSVKGAAQQGSVSVRSLVYRPELDAPLATAVHHRYTEADAKYYPGIYPSKAGALQGSNDFARGYNWVLHPATEMLDSGNFFIALAGYAVGLVLLVPAVIAGVLNSVAGNSRLTQGTLLHTHD